MAEESRPVRRAVMVKPGAAPASAPFTVAPDAPPKRSAPLGVVVLAVFDYLGGLVGVAMGAVALVLAFAGTAALSEFNAPAWVKSTISLVGAIVALFAFAYAMFLFLLGTATWKGRPWAWTCTQVFNVIFLIVGAIGFLGSLGSPADAASSLLMLAITVLILWYLYTPDVKAFFGKAHMRALWQRQASA